MIFIMFIVTPIISLFTIFKFGTFEIKVWFRDDNGYWIQLGSVDSHSFLRVRKIETIGSRSDLDPFIFMGPDPRLKKMPEPGPMDPKDSFSFYEP